MSHWLSIELNSLDETYDTGLKNFVGGIFEGMILIVHLYRSTFKSIRGFQCLSVQGSVGNNTSNIPMIVSCLSNKNTFPLQQPQEHCRTPCWRPVFAGAFILWLVLSNLGKKNIAHLFASASGRLSRCSSLCTRVRSVSDTACSSVRCEGSDAEDR